MLWSRINYHNDMVTIYSVMHNGASAFFLAAQNGHANVLQLLLSLPGVDPHGAVTNANGDQVRRTCSHRGPQ